MAGFPGDAVRRRTRPYMRMNSLAVVVVAVATAAIAIAGASERYLPQDRTRGPALSFVALEKPLLQRRINAAQAAATADPFVLVDTESAEDTLMDSRTSNATDLNASLLLGSGFPDSGRRPGVDQGPPWVTCHVEYTDKCGRDEHGSVLSKTVLEEWVMKGRDDVVLSFRLWRLRDLGASAAMRCFPTKKAIEDVRCLACVPRSAALPFSPQGQLHPVQQGFLSSYVLTISGVDQCLAGSLGGSSFCKSGSVALAM